MQRLDAIVAATGAVVLAVAIVGAAVYGGTAAAETFRISFSERDVSLPEQSGTASGEGFTASFNVTQFNLTKASVAVTLTGSAARLIAAPFVVQVTGPGNLSGQGEGQLPSGAGATGTSEVVLAIGQAPADHDYTAAGAEAASAHAQTLSTSAGTGTWTVVVRASPQVPPNEAITAEVVLTLTSFEGAVQRDAVSLR